MDDPTRFGLTPAQLARLPDRQRRFLHDLHDVLARYGLAPDSAEIVNGTVELEVTSPVSAESSLLVTIDPDEVVVSCLLEHWHHARSDIADGRLHPWSGEDGMEVGLRFIEAVVDGTIEVELRYGILGTKATTWWRDESGRRHVVQRSRTLLPPFRRSTERHRLAFSEPA